mgnify:CR=1 FL=1
MGSRMLVLLKAKSSRMGGSRGGMSQYSGTQAARDYAFLPLAMFHHEWDSGGCPPTCMCCCRSRGSTCWHQLQGGGVGNEVPDPMPQSPPGLSLSGRLLARSSMVAGLWPPRLARRVLPRFSLGAGCRWPSWPSVAGRKLQWAAPRRLSLWHLVSHHFCRQPCWLCR